MGAAGICCCLIVERGWGLGPGRGVITLPDLHNLCSLCRSKGLLVCVTSFKTGTT